MPEWITDPKPIIAIIVTIFGIGYTGYRVRRAKSDHKSFERFMKVVLGDATEILSRPEPAVTKTNSPAQLAEDGIKIADRLHARDWARRAAPDLLADIHDKKPLEIAEGRTQAANTSLLDRQWRRKVRRTSFKLGVDTDSVLLVMRIVLKDELMRLASERDLHDG